MESAAQEITRLTAQNTDLREERAKWQITGTVCTWTVLTSRIIRNEERIQKLKE